MAFESKILSITPAEPGWTVTVSESHRPDDGTAEHSDWADYGPFPVLSWALVETEQLSGKLTTEVQPVFLSKWSPERCPAVNGVTYPSKLHEFQSDIWEKYSGLVFKLSPPRPVNDVAAERVARLIADEAHKAGAPVHQSRLHWPIEAASWGYFDDGLTLAEARGWVVIGTDGRIAPGVSMPADRAAV